MGAMSLIALFMASVSVVLSGIAYWRTGGRVDIEALRTALARRVRGGYEDSLARIKRAEARLAGTHETLSAETRQAVDALRAQLVAARQEAEAGLQGLESDVSMRAQSAQEALRKRVLRMEGRVQLVAARAEIVRAERLAEKQDFQRANDLLEEAVAKVREVKLRLSDAFEEVPAYNEVLQSLQAAIRSVRQEAADHERRIDRVLSASDRLLASLGAREQAIV